MQFHSSFAESEQTHPWPGSEVLVRQKLSLPMQRTRRHHFPTGAQEVCALDDTDRGFLSLQSRARRDRDRRRAMAQHDV